MRRIRLLYFATMLYLIMTAAALAAAEGSDDWKPETYTYLQKAPADRIVVNLPRGLVARCTVTDGMIEYVIDAEATDWESVMASCYRPDSGQTYLKQGIRMPAGAASRRSMQYSVDPMTPESTVISRLQNQGLNSGDAFSSMWMGRYDESAATYQPLEFLRPWGMAALWYDSSNQCIGGEYVLYTIAYTNADARTVRMPGVPKGMLTTNAMAGSMDYGTAIKASASDGAVRYQVDDPSALNRFDLYTAVAAPDIDGVDAGRLTCYARAAQGGDFMQCAMADPGSNGLSRRSAMIRSDLSREAKAEQTVYMLDWRDEAGQSRYVASLTVSVFCGNSQPWPVYEGMTQIPESRLKLEAINPIASGVRLTYDGNSGIAYAHIEPDRLPESASYGEAVMQLTITPPQGAAAYRLAKGNGEMAFGRRPGAMSYVQGIMNSRENRPVGDGLTLSQRLFETYRQERDDLTLYMTAMMPGELAAEYTVIYWYRNPADTEPMSREYVFMQMDSCLRRQVSSPYTSEDQLPSRLTAPVIVIPNDNAAAQMQFVAEMYPQEAEGARYYELHLLDKNGKSAHLPAKSRIILYYPEGVSPEQAAISFHLSHLNSKHQTFETFSVEDGTLHCEENYMWFTPGSLSPFVLQWEQLPAKPDLPAAPDLPATGDRSWPVAVPAVMAFVCIALIWRLRRREA